MARALGYDSANDRFGEGKSHTTTTAVTLVESFTAKISMTPDAALPVYVPLHCCHQIFLPANGYPRSTAIFTRLQTAANTTVIATTKPVATHRYGRIQG
ncbi:MAG: hypothetical protein Q7K57_19620 [Burkholderiaceae bacterium]|nr:hypothetical protein [Burkholderiaceae bacterium]